MQCLPFNMEKAMAPHSSTLAWKIPWTEEPDGLQSMGSLRVRHDWAMSLSRIGEGNGNLLHCSCLENPRDVGAWWVAVYGVAQSRTRLKWLSSILQHPVCLAGVLPWVRHFWLKYLYDAWCLSSHEYPPTKSTCSPGQPLIIIRFPLFLCLLGTSVLLCIL